MAQVLSAHVQAEGQPYYPSSGLRRSRPSQPSLYIPRQTSPPSRSQRRTQSRNTDTGALSTKHRSLSSPSRLNDLANVEKALLPKPKPQSSTKLAPKDQGTSSDTLFSNYSFLPARIDEESTEAPPSSPQQPSILPDEPGRAITVTRRLSQTLIKAEDDTAMKHEPSRHVDYLSHDWKEEDIWSSWRHITSQRKVYGERSRLENASWRTWAKQKNKLRTVHPQNLNWLKDCDVTWLYGPLQTATSYVVSQHVSEPMSNLSKNNSFLNKKPILKKRSVSELMLQKSLSNSSLVRQAAAAVQLQRSPFDALYRRPSDYTDTHSSVGTSQEGTDYFSSQSTSGFHSPVPEQLERKHIRFDNKVEQCIAVEIKDGDYDEDEPTLEGDESENELLMMRRSRRRKTKPKVPRSLTNDSKIIAKLPSTTLKDRVESLNPDLLSHSLGTSPLWKPRLSPSASVETLRPPNPSKNFIIEEEEEEDEDNEQHSSWSLVQPRDEDDKLGLQDEIQAKLDYEEERNGRLRRTESGMFMPVEEEEDAQMGGIVGRVLDTVNTARDIAHVIWNVGWRR